MLKTIFFKLIFLFLVFVLSGCNGIGWKSNIREEKNLVDLLTSSYYPYSWDELLSPDGQWLIRGPFGHNDPISVISTNTKTKSLKLSASDDAGWEQVIEGWSPDSKMFTAAGYSTPPGKCLFDRIIIYHLIDDAKLVRNIFKFPKEDTNCFGFMWSPDSSSIAVNTQKNIYIFDNQAQVVKKIDHMDARYGMFWSRSGLYWATEKENQVELWKLTKNSRAELLTDMVFKSNTLLSLISINPSESKILFSTRTLGQASKDTLYIYDMQEKKFAREEFLPGLIGNRTILPSGSIVGFTVNQFDPIKNIFYTFDWKDLEITEHGDIGFLVGWRSNVGGFVSVTENEDQYKLSVIKP